MKTMKVALLATAALAAVSVSARADDTAAIKAQLEALTARIAQLEAAPAVPVGFSLLTVSEGTQTVVPGLGTSAQQIAREGDKATIIGVLPTADAPASTTIEWSGYILAAIAYYDAGDGNSEDDADIDVNGRAQIKVVGKTDTAIGEVGVLVKLRSDFDGQQINDPSVWLEEGWGWWAMTPELTLGGGVTGSLGNIGYGYDGACSCYWSTDGADVDLNPGDTSQMRLSYASGPISAAIALEDATDNTIFSPAFGDTNALGAAAEIKYSGDSFNGEISAVWRDGYEAGPYSEEFYQIGAGVGFSLGDMFAISAGAALGQTTSDSDFWAASILASMNLSDTTHIELGYGHKEYDAGNVNPDYDVDGFLAGVYWDPVDQLTIGVEGEYIDDESKIDEVMQIGLITVYRF